MKYIIVDTNVVSYLMKGHSTGELYKPHFRQRRQSISFMSVAEIYEWALRRGWGAKRWKELDRDLEKYLVVPYSIELAQIWAHVRFERRNQPIATDDAWIAASALYYQVPLLTHNPVDFRKSPAWKSSRN